MANYVKQLLRNSSTRILAIIFFCLIGLTTFFLSYGYFAQLAQFERAELDYLEGIAITIAGQIDAENHQQLLNDYPKEEAIAYNDDDARYAALNQLLRDAKLANNLPSDIYTLVKDDDADRIYFAVSSSDIPYFRHEWRDFKPEHLADFETGGRVHPYTDEHGTWLSAFAPIRNQAGETVAVVQVDTLFDAFIAEARATILKTSLISLAVFLVIALFMLKSIRDILRKEEEMSREMQRQKEEIEQQNKDIMDSIHYAKRIQDAILPPVAQIREVFPDSFVLFKPRDIVSGDFYWFARRDNIAYLAAVDCTGHGVPGAFMSMIGNTLLNDIVNVRQEVNTCEILNHLDRGIVNALQQEDLIGSNRDGMDLALCSFDLERNVMQYSGAFRPLYHVRGNEIIETKGDKFPIGGGNCNAASYTRHEVQLEPGDAIYMFSDGFPDQFGGDKGKKFMSKRFRQLLTENAGRSMGEQEAAFMQAFRQWQGDNEQVDDVLVIGVRVPGEASAVRLVS